MKSTSSTAASDSPALDHAVPAAPPWAPASPAGLVAVAAATSGLFALLGGHVGPGGLPLLGCWLLGGFVIQLVTAILELKSGNLLGGNTFLFLGGFMMLTGGIEMIMTFNIVAGGGAPDGHLDGYIWAALSLVLWLWTPAYFTPFSLLSVIFALLDVALPVMALVDLGILPGEFMQISAWAFLAVALVAAYFSAAIVVNTVRGKKFYPMP